MIGNGLYTDVDGDLDEMDDEDVDEAFGEDDGLAERRRRRRGRAPNVKGRGYNQPRLEKSFVTQAQLQAATARIGEDIRKLAASTKAIDARIDAGLSKLKKESAQSNQMAALLPLLMRPPVVKASEKGTVDPGQELLSGKQDSMSMLLPLLLMGGLGGNGGSTGGNDMMMLALVMMATQQK